MPGQGVNTGVPVPKKVDHLVLFRIQHVVAHHAVLAGRTGNPGRLFPDRRQLPEYAKDFEKMRDTYIEEGRAEMEAKAAEMEAKAKEHRRARRGRKRKPDDAPGT